MKRYSIIGPIFLILVWMGVSKLGLVDSFFLPDPFVTAQQLFQLLVSGSIVGDLAATLGRTALAFVGAGAIGLPFGLWLGRTESSYRSVEFIIDFFRSTPALAIFPLFILVFGISDFSKIAIAAFAASLIIIFNTAYGVINARKSRILAVKIMGASRRQIFRHVLIWESLSQTFVGLRNAVSMCLVVIVATEMFIGTTLGLGRRIVDAQLIYEVPTMYATILLTGMVGYLANLIFLLAEKKLLHWSGR